MDPTNGIITFTGETSGFMTMATYSCNPGYGLSGGDSVRTCTSSSVGAGEWTGTSPTCEGMFYLVYFDTMYRNFNSLQEYKPTILILCTSAAITCPALSDPTNGQVTFATDPTVPYDYGTVATYSCGTGFGLSGDIMRTCGGDGLTTDGVWSGIESTCEGEHIIICIGSSCYGTPHTHTCSNHLYFSKWNQQ